MVSKRLKGNYFRSYEKFGKIGRTSLFFTQKSDSRYFHPRTGTPFDGFTIIFLVDQKNQMYDQKF